MVTCKNILPEKYVFKLKDIFDNNGWDINDKSVEVVFDSFCERLALFLEKEEYIDLILDLTKDYLWVRSDTYEKHFIEAFKSLFKNAEWIEICKLKKNNSICICPLVRSEDFKKIKSGSAMAYLSQGVILQSCTELNDKQVRVVQSPEVFGMIENKENTERSENSEGKEKDKNSGTKSLKENICAIILVDDFIGTGETAIECLTYISSQFDRKVPVFVVSLVIQEAGYQAIKRIYPEVELFCTFKRTKGITDKYSDYDEVKKNLNMMRNISKCITESREDNIVLGFNGSEALVSMVKTPNNTFPVFWKQSKGNRAPFPRLGNFKAV